MCGLFTDYIGTSESTASSDRAVTEYWIGMNVEGSDRGLIWGRPAVSRASGKTEENYEKIRQDGVSLGMELNPCPPAYEVVPTLWRLR